VCLPDRPYEEAGPHRRARPRGIQVRSNRARRQRAAGRCAAGSRGVRGGAGQSSGRCGGPWFALARASPPPFRPGGPGSGRPRMRGPPIGHRLVVNEHNSTAVPFLPAIGSSRREFSFGLLVGRLPVTRCGAGPVVRRPDAQLLRRRLDGHAERINTDGDGHDCQRPSCGNPRSCGHRPRPAGRQPFHRDGVPRVTTGFRRSGGASVVSRLASPDGRTGGNCPGTA
jgi:hypothetical protein